MNVPGGNAQPPAQQPAPPSAQQPAPPSASGTEPEAGATSAEADTTERADFRNGLHSKPATNALPVIDTQTAQLRAVKEHEDTVYELRSAAARLEEALLEGKRVLTRKEVAKLGETSTVSARKLWRALGMSRVPEGEKGFTVKDAEALKSWAKPVTDGVIDEDTALSLARAIGHTTDRLVVWQMETLVEFLAEDRGISEAEARRVVLGVFEELIDPLQDMLVYSWRRNLAGVLGRLNINVFDGLRIDNRQGWYDSSMPLARAVGFIDLVSYTRLSQQMEPRQLAAMVKHFQDLAYNIVATGGGRIIKTVGDEVFFAAETPAAGAEIALTLQQQVGDSVQLPKARVGFVWGKVLSRLGDIFGSTVNLAARLTAVAEPGTVLTDSETARVLSQTEGYVFTRKTTITLHGLGPVEVLQMERGSAPALQMDIED